MLQGLDYFEPYLDNEVKHKIYKYIDEFKSKVKTDNGVTDISTIMGLISDVLDYAKNEVKRTILNNLNTCLSEIYNSMLIEKDKEFIASNNIKEWGFINL